MVRGQFPSLLMNRARLVGSLTRRDLALFGLMYLGLSLFKISGIKALALNYFLYLLLKLWINRLPKNYFLGVYFDLKHRRSQNWSVESKLEGELK